MRIATIESLLFPAAAHPAFGPTGAESTGSTAAVARRQARRFPACIGCRSAVRWLSASGFENVPRRVK